jgi:hypothetical protein
MKKTQMQGGINPGNLANGNKMRTTKNQLEVIYNPQVGSVVLTHFDDFLRTSDLNVNKTNDLAQTYISKVGTKDRTIDD